MDLRHLRACMALAEERHFGRAAARLHVAQPALSQQVRQLERELGCRLFDRTTRRVEPTEAGLLFLERARAVLADLDDARDDLARLAAGRLGRVRLGFVGTATYDVLPRVARRVRADLPDVDLQVRGEVLALALLDAVRGGDLDLAVVRPGPDDGSDRDADEGSGEGAGLVVETLRAEPLVAGLPAHHPAADRERVDLADLAGEAFVTHPAGRRSVMHGRVLAACRRAGFAPAEEIEVGETATLVVFVAAGLGVALVPASVQALGLDGVAFVPLAEPETVPLALVRRGESTPAALAVADVVRAMTA